jgi:hypothetical protein
MATVGQTVTYSVSNNGTPAGTYGSWSVAPGTAGTDWNMIPVSNSGLNSIQVQWLSTTFSPYTIAVTATNSCSNLLASKQETVTGGGCVSLTPSGGSATIVSQTSTTYTVNVIATNGTTFDFCVGTFPILCTWDCTPSPNGCGSFSTGNHTFNKGSNNDACISYRVYNACCTQHVEFTENYTGVGLATIDNVYVLSNCNGGFGNVLIGGNTGLSNGTVIKASDINCYTITGTALNIAETKTITSFPANCAAC